jgi:hypothetical protein
MCFFDTMNYGVRHGDLEDNMDYATMQDNKAYSDRMAFEMMFFVVVGVLLFDIVTGIIIDTFGGTFC